MNCTTNRTRATYNKHLMAKKKCVPRKRLLKFSKKMVNDVHASLLSSWRLCLGVTDGPLAVAIVATQIMLLRIVFCFEKAAVAVDEAFHTLAHNQLAWITIESHITKPPKKPLVAVHSLHLFVSLTRSLPSVLKSPNSCGENADDFVRK